MGEKLRKNQRLSNIIFGTIDISITAVVFVISLLLTSTLTKTHFSFSHEFIFILIVVVFIWVVLLKMTNLARIPRTSSYSIIFGDFLKLSLIGGIILLVINWLTTFSSIPSLAIILFAIINLITLFTLRIITFKLFKIYRAGGHNARYVIIIAGDNSLDFIHKLLDQKEWGFKIHSIVTNSNLIREQLTSKVRIYPENINIRSLLQFDIVDEIICIDSKLKEEKKYELLQLCSELGVIFRINSLKKIKSANRSRVYYFDKMPFFTVETSPRNSIGHLIKYILEVLTAFIILFFLSPLLLLISIAIKVTSKGPVIFKQKRVGIRGRKFYIYKFRTMVFNAEEILDTIKNKNESDGPVFKIKKDPRITIIGKILRKTNLDEIPQLFNVIKGEMSIIGPRPPLPHEVEKYERWQLKRLSVKPGLTCSWQIMPNRNDVEFKEWMELDIDYIETWSLKKDLQLFIKTFKSIVLMRGY